MKKRVLSALLALCLTLSLAGAAFAENEPSGDSSSAVSQAVSSVESEPQTQDETVSSDSASGEDQTAAKTESTPAPTETPAASDVAEEEPESTASKAEVEFSTAETAQEPSYLAQDFEAEVEGTEVVVNVSAPKGALPEDVTLTASLVGSSEDNADDQAVADVAAELDDADVEYDGFVALDISFVDADGNKVEPLQPVSVNFTLPAELLPEDVDASTLEVQHLKEDAETEEVVAVETVADTADATEGTVTVDAPVATLSEDTNSPLSTNAEVTAEFSVDGFSTFTITWQSLTGFFKEEVQVVLWNSTDDIGMTGSEVDALTNALENCFKDTLKYGETVTKEQFENIINQYSITGFTYEGIYYGNEDDGNWVQSGDFESICVEGGLDVWAYYVNGSNWAEALFSGKPSIHIEYRRNTTNVIQPPDGIGIDNGKRVDEKGDGSGNYDLTLSVTGDQGTVTNKQKLDVLFVLDNSGSMDESFGYGSRMDAANAAIQSIAGIGDNNGLGDNRALDVKFSIVTFDGDTSGYKDDADIITFGGNKWVTLNELTQNVGNIPDGKDGDGGTNYQAGLQTGKSMFEDNENSSGRADAAKVVIFISDGNPGYYYTSNGTTTGYGDPKSQGVAYNWQALQNAKNECRNFDVDYFYVVGVSDSVNNYVLKQLVYSAALVPDTNKGFYESTDSAQLLEAFNKIQEQITFFACSDVQMVDPLSENVEIVKTNGTVNFEVIVEKQNTENESGYENLATKSVSSGQAAHFSIEGKNFSVTPRYDDQSRTIYVDFDSNYQLQQGYRYLIKTTITPSEDATEPSDGYKDLADSDTGTYQDQYGLYTNVNENALVHFEVGSESDGTGTRTGSKLFPKPVIRVPEKFMTLTVTKTVTGAMASNSDDFTFQLTLEKTENAVVDNGPDTLTVHYSDTPSNITNRPTSLGKTTGRYEFPLRNGETVEITIPYGYTAALTEVGLEDTGYQTFYREADQANSHPEANLDENGKPITDTGVTGHYTSGNSISDIDMSTNHVYQFVNFRPVVAPTGLEDNHTKPFGLMVGVAVMAGLALVGGAVVRRRRRWME